MRLIYLIIAALFLLSGGLLAQNPQTADEDVIEIGAIKIDARIELPQVQILDKRITPEFEEVRVEKSFSSELSGKSEELQFEPVTSGRVKQIKDLEKLLSKKRF